MSSLTVKVKCKENEHRDNDYWIWPSFSMTDEDQLEYDVAVPICAEEGRILFGDLQDEEIKTFLITAKEL